VSAIDDEFDPATATIDPGDTVMWSNDGESVHTVTADDGSFDSGPMEAGATFSFAFEEPGTYAYFCAVHGAAGGVGMSGTIQVGAAAPPPSGGGGGGGSQSQDPTQPQVGPAEALPATGLATDVWLVLAFAQLVTGAALLVLGRVLA
jgi:hypothetical protein